MGCLVGFLLGEIVATLMIQLSAQLSHFPGGLRALSKLSSPPWWSNVCGLVGLWIGFATSIFYAHEHAGLRSMDHQWRLKASDIYFVVLGVGCQILVDLAYAPFHFKSLNKPVNHLFGAEKGLTFVLVGILTTFGAPIVEEWFFRGTLFRALDAGMSRSFGRAGTIGAVLVSACLFGLAHGEPLQFAGLAFLGVVLAVVLKRTQRLTPSIITHASFNAVAFISLIAQRAGH